MADFTAVKFDTSCLLACSVTDIRFLIERNPQLSILNLDDGAGLRHSPVHARLAGLGVGDRLARQWLAQHGEAAVAERLDHVAEQGDVRHPPTRSRARGWRPSSGGTRCSTT